MWLEIERKETVNRLDVRKQNKQTNKQIRNEQKAHYKWQISLKQQDQNLNIVQQMMEITVY